MVWIYCTSMAISYDGDYVSEKVGLGKVDDVAEDFEMQPVCMA